MVVTLHHADGVVTEVVADLQRAPWTTCPGAEAKLAETFTGVALAEVSARGEKTANCTHLHDLATLSAAHAFDAAPIVYDVLVSDPADGVSTAELRIDGASKFVWSLEGFKVVAPENLAGQTLDKLRGFLEVLGAGDQEAIRLFRWAIMIASGRSIPMEHQSDATKIPPNCFTFQPVTAARAKRVGVIRDFSAANTGTPLDGWSADARNRPKRTFRDGQMMLY
jgi:hypothetical protein